MKKVLFKYLIVFFTFFSFGIKINALSNISVSEGTLNPYFEKNTYKYNIFLNKDIQNININAVLDDEDDYVTGIGDTKLKNGINEIKLNLYKKDGSSYIYTLKIFVGEEIDDNKYMLKKLEIENYEINYEPNTFNYKLNIEEEKELKIKYEVGEGVNIKLKGNSNLKSGSEIIITVSNGDNTHTYKIKISSTKETFKEEKEELIKESIFSKIILNKSDKIILRIFISLITLFLILLLYYLLFKKKIKK